MSELKSSHDSTTIAKEIQALGPKIHFPVPNPAPLGLFAFGLTTALLQMKHTRITGTSDEDMDGTEHLVWGFAVFYGGLLQVIAGLCEIRRNNIFGYTAFLSYGGFWMSLATAHIVSLLAEPGTVNFNPKASQAMLALMGIFTFVLWICTFKMNKTLCLLIFFLMTTFFLLAAGVDSEPTDYVAGWFGLITAAIAYWLAAAELINDINGEGNEIIPIGHWSSNKFKRAGMFHVPGRIHGVTQRAAARSSSRRGNTGEENSTLSTRRLSVDFPKTFAANGSDVSQEPQELDLELPAASGTNSSLYVNES